MKKDKDDSVQQDESVVGETKKKKKLLISIRDLATDEAAHVSGGKPPINTGPTDTIMCCW